MRRTDDDLRGASRDVLYEIVQLDQSVGLLAERQWIEPLRNALLESFCIHVRTVLDFLGPRPDPKPEDVIAEDFFDDGTVWNNVRPQGLRCSTMHVGE